MVILMCVFMLSLIVPCDIVSCDIMPRLVAPFYYHPKNAVIQGQQQICVEIEKTSKEKTFSSHNFWQPYYEFNCNLKLFKVAPLVII
jgi:hypothetical protein